MKTATSYGLALLLVSSSALADEGQNTREAGVVGTASAATSFYDDTEGNFVVTPAAAATVKGRDGVWSLRGRYLVDVISAASVDAVSAASADVASGASSGAVHWHEIRQATVLGGEYKPQNVGVGVEGSISSEPDHLFFGGGPTLEWDVADGPVTLLAGYARGATSSDEQARRSA